MSSDLEGFDTAPHRVDGAAAGDPPPELGQAAWRSALAGVRRGSYLAGIAAGLLCIPGLGLTFFAAGSGRGWSVPSFLIAGLAGCASAVILAGLVGAVLGLLREWIRRARPQVSRAPVKQPRRRRAARWLVVALVVTMALVFPLAFFLGREVGSVVDWQLARAAAAADRSDPYWRIDDLFARRQSVPDSQNAALVVVRAEALLPKYGPDGVTEMYDVLQRERRALEKLADDEPLSQGLADELRAVLEAGHESLGLARTLAGYSRGRYELTLGPKIFDTPLPDIQKLRSISQLLCADSLIRVGDNEPDGALDSCRAMFGAARSIGDEPFLISQLVRIVHGMAALQATRRVLAHGEPSDRALAQMQAVVLDELDQPFFLYAVRGERATHVEIIRRLGAGEVTLLELSNSKDGFDPHRHRDPVTGWARLWYDLEQAVALERLNDAVAIEHGPVGERLARWEKWETRLRVPRNSLRFWFVMLPVTVFPNFVSVAISASNYRADLGATAILLAALRHRKKTRKWPESIAAIDKSILVKPPDDPFGGQPYHFEHRDGDVLIYSVGPNGRDEHGQRDKLRWSKGGEDDVAARGRDAASRRQQGGAGP